MSIKWKMTTPIRDEEVVKKAKEHAIRHIGAIGLVGNDKSLTECFLIEAFKVGAAWGRKQAISEQIDYLKKYREAYGEEFCPPRKLEEFDGMLRTVVGFHMGRFLIDNMIKDCSELLEPKGDKS